MHTTAEKKQQTPTRDNTHEVFKAAVQRLTSITDAACQIEKKIVRNIAPTNALTKATLVSSDSLSKTRKPQIVNAGEVALKRSTNTQHTSYFIRCSADCPDQVSSRPLS